MTLLFFFGVCAYLCFGAVKQLDISADLDLLSTPQGVLNRMFLWLINFMEEFDSG